MEDSDLPDLSQTHPYTCNSCAVAFRNSDAQRNHMRSDWHRYNLKRKVAELPPVSEEDYNEKVVSAQAAAKATAAGATFSKSCEICQKNYFSENAYQNHVASQKHKLRAAAVAQGSQRPTPVSQQPRAEPKITDPEAEAEFEQVVNGLKQTSLSQQDPLSRRPSHPHPSAQGQANPHPLSPSDSGMAERESEAVSENATSSRCFFCNYDSPSWKLSISHMTKFHGLFIPEETYLVDTEGLLAYLQAKITQNHECLWCHKWKSTSAGIQTHMRDKGHCRIAFETEEEMIEVGQFYDFSSTYSDAEGEDSDTEMNEVKTSTNGGVKVPKTHGNTVEEEAWETDSEFSSLASDEIVSIHNDDHSGQYQRLSLNRHHSHTDPRPHKSLDGYHSHAHHHGAVFYDEHELYLPSGRVAGHRSLNKYFRQNPRSYPSASERMENAQRLLRERASRDEDGDAEMGDGHEHDRSHSQPQALSRRSEAGMLGATRAQKREVTASHIRGVKQMNREQNHFQAKVAKRGNQQKHFRVSPSP